MRLSTRPSALVQRTKSLSHALARAFPTPALLTPPAAGIDISDSSIKWLSLKAHGQNHRISKYGEFPLHEGIVTGGIIRDIPALSEMLVHVKKELGGISCAHAALPEEAAYVFSMHVPLNTSRQQTLRMIEFEFEDRVPIPPSAAVYDFSVIPHESNTTDEISVVVFPREIAEAYVSAFEDAGITLLSLEIEARSIARAVSSLSPDEPITLIVDFGRARTGFAVVKHGYPIFTSTVEVGGERMTQALIEKMAVTPEEAERFKNEQGLAGEATSPSKGLEVVAGTAAALADEIARQYHYWDTRRNERGERMTPVGKIILVGGSSNLNGLPEYISGRVRAFAERGNIWQHVAPFDEYVPPIDKNQSLQFATAVGLAMRGI